MHPCWARIDRLGADRPILQLLAVLGPIFSLESLLEISEYGRPVLVAALGRLVDAGMLVQNEETSRNRYQFRHALIQEVAYASVLRRTRSKLHEQGRRGAFEPAGITTGMQTRKFSRGIFRSLRDPSEAIPFWQAAGDRLARQSAHTEAALAI